MKRVYLDTNLILAPFRMQDPVFSLMETIRNQKHIQFVTSTLSIIEIYNVILREDQTFSQAILQLSNDKDPIDLQNFTIDLQIHLAIEYLLQYYNISILSDDKPEFEIFQANRIKLNPIFKLTLNFKINMKLRTLDLLHYCYAKYYTEYKDLHIHYLITADIVFQSARESLKSNSTFIIISAETFIDIEC